MGENSMMNGVISQMQIDLETTQREALKLENQLTCLIELVRRAWLGDSFAASDVAKIVGVAPPEIGVQEQNDVMAITTKPRSKVLHNWVALTVGLLNRDYKMSQQSTLNHQHDYLVERNEYLNHQIIRHDDLINAGPSQTQQTGKRFINNDISKQMSLIRPATGKKRVKHLYRSAVTDANPSEEKNEKRSEVPLTWGDLFVKGYQKSDTDLVLHNSVEYRRNMMSRQTDQSDGDRLRSYEDPDRYTKFDLFELDNLLNENMKRPGGPRPRPKTSVQRSTSARRGRPTSSVNKAHGEQSSHTRPRTAHPGRQLPSQQHQQQHQHQQQQQQHIYPDLTVHSVTPVGPSPARTDVHKSAWTDTTPLSSSFQIKKSASASSQQQQYLGRTLSEQYRRDIEKEGQFEREFRKTTGQLQKKLGLNLDGMV